MKRTIVLTLLALFWFTAAHAQQQFATLQHGDNISVFYGINALPEAYAVATDGDIITLSPGSFNTYLSGKLIINKPITIRGAGMWADSLRTPSTVIDIVGQGFEVNIQNNRDSVYKFSLEGVYVNGYGNNRFVVENANTPSFVKCYFKAISRYDAVNNEIFMNCIIEEWGGAPDNTNAPTFYNCGIIGYQGGTSLPIVDLPKWSTLVNCVACLRHNTGTGGQQDAEHYNIINSIVYCDNNYSLDVNNTITNSYSIGININASRAFFTPAFAEYRHLYNFDDLSQVFKNFNGFLQNGHTFELQDSIANTLIGSDGTQIGIYGGQAPFNPRVLNYSVSVANQSRADGKLEVTIQPINE